MAICRALGVDIHALIAAFEREISKETLRDPDKRFAKQDKSFWACIRSLSQELGYTERGEDRVKVPSIREMREGFVKLQLNPSAIVDAEGRSTKLAELMLLYFEYRSKILWDIAKSNLMNLDVAREEFDKLKSSFDGDPKCYFAYE